ncbi:MAG: hypothetical protein RIR49_1468 [Actinomycetota bacterium]
MGESGPEPVRTADLVQRGGTRDPEDLVVGATVEGAHLVLPVPSISTVAEGIPGGPALADGPPQAPMLIITCLMRV